MKFHGSGEPNKKGSKKGLIIAIIIVLILALAGGAYYYFFVKEDTKLQLSEKDKITNAFDKVEAKLDEITDSYDAIDERKISKNLETKPFKSKYTISAEINELNNVSGVNASDVDKIKQIVAGQQVVIEGQGNLAEKKVYAELTALGQKLGNLIFTENAIGVQVPYVEQKYYALFKDTASSSKYSKEIAELLESFKYATDDKLNLDQFKFSDSEEKHFDDTYGKILDKYVSDDKLNKESTEVTIDGKNKKCDKVTYTLNNEEIKKVLKDYLTTFKNDQQGQDIILNKVADFSEKAKILETLGVSKSDLTSKIKSSISEGIDEVISAIDTIPLDKAEIVVYATSMETYKIDLSIYQGEQSGTLSIELKDKGISMDVSALGQKLVSMSIENNNNEFKVVADMDGKANFTLTDTKEGNSRKVVASAKVVENYKESKVELNITTNVNEDSENKLNEDARIGLVADIDGQKIDVALKFNQEIEIVDSVNVPEINKAEAIDIVKEGYLDKILDEVSESMNLKTSGSLNSSIFNNQNSLNDNSNSITNNTTTDFNTTTDTQTNNSNLSDFGL